MNTADKPVVVVSGLGRCGSSLTMQMLHACGLRCAGEFPAFEPEESNVLNGLSADWLRRFEAVKILDPHRGGKFPLTNVSVIWIDRNPAQQAISQVKFVQMVGGLHIEQGAAGKMCKSLQRERPMALRKYYGMNQVHVSFEDAILATEGFCRQIAEFLSPWYVLDKSKMASVVRPRSNGAKVQCDMEIEMELCAGGEQ